MSAPLAIKVDLAAGGPAQDLFAANAAPMTRWVRNRGPHDAIIRIGATADTTHGWTLQVGERRDLPYRTGLRVSAWAAAVTTIEGEES